MEPVRHKLEEAKYFLGKMEETKASHDLFSFNLSAFLSAARSVPQILLFRYQGRAGFQAWYDGQMADPLLGFFRNQRNESIHRRPVGLDVELPDGETFPQAKLIERSGGSYTVRASVAGSPLVADLGYVAIRLPWGAEYTVYVNYKWKFDDFPNELPYKNDVIELCTSLVERLERFVAEAQFGA